LVIPAQAKQGSEYGFLPLVTQADPARPLFLQARQAFELLVPDLLAAQHSGAILSFEPDFSAGILQVEYPTGARAAAPAALQGLDNINAAAALVPHPMPAGARMGGAFSPSFSFNLYSTCFSASGLGANSRVVGYLYNTSGRVVANFAGTANPGGYFPGSTCFDSGGSTALVVPGYQMVFNVYDPSSVLLGTYSAKVPKIAFTGYKSATSVLSVSATKNKPYTINWTHPNYDAGQTQVQATQTGTVPASGKWSIHFTSPKFRGGDWFTLHIIQDSTFQFAYSYSIPYLSCYLGSFYCYLYGGSPQAPAALTITHAGVAYKFTGKFYNAGMFIASLYDASGAPIFLAAGDKITGTGVPVAFKLPKISAVPDYTTDTVNGKAPANRFFLVDIKDVSANKYYGIWTGSTAAGAYSANFSGLVTLTAGSPYALQVYYTDKVSGNQTFYLAATAP
jgi:hypothetical protein